MRKRSAVSAREWNEIKGMYEAGATLTSISQKYRCSAQIINRRAIKELWEQGKYKKLIDKKSDLLKNIMKIDMELKETLSAQEIDGVNEVVIDLAELRFKANQAQHEMLELVNISARQVKKIIENSPTGLYVKSRGKDFENFGRSTEFVKDLLPVMPIANEIIGLNEQNTTNVQINKNSEDEKVTIHVEGV